MVINRIHIDSFGAQEARTLSFSDGLNIAEGENESGKTTVAAFLAFLLYGTIPTFAQDCDVLSGWAEVTCHAKRTLTVDGGETVSADAFRITRTKRGAEYSCTVFAVTDGALGTQNVLGAGEEPGEFFFGVSARVFAATAMVTQVSASARGDHTQGDGSKTTGDAVRAAMERILYAADEQLDPMGAIARLTNEKNALYDAAAGRGTIATLEKQRDALAGALTAQEKELAAQQERAQASSAAPQTEDPETAGDAETDAMPAENPGEELPEPPPFSEAETLAKTEAAIVGYEEKKRAKEARIKALSAQLDAYRLYREMENTDTLNGLLGRESAASKRAESLASSMFRGGYIPDADYTEALYLCASDMAAADADIAATNDAEKKLAFSVSRDNLKENQLRRLSLDGGANAVLEKYDGISARRSVVTVFGVLFLFFAVLALAATIVMLILHNDAITNCVLITAVLGALSGCFFFCRGRFQKRIDVMLTRYSCATEDELENFIEEFVLNETKLQNLDENKDALSKQRSEASLRAGEAARQAALLLSKLQPPGSTRIAAERLSAEVIEKAAERIARAQAEITRQQSAARDAREQIDAIFADFGVSDLAEFEALRATLEKTFAGTGTDADGAQSFSEESVLREIDFHTKACAAMDAKLNALKTQRDALRAAAEQHRIAHAAVTEQPQPAQAWSKQSRPLPAAANAADCLPDSALLRALLAEMDAELRRERRRYAALTLAIETMAQAKEQLHAEIAPRLLEKAGHLMRLLTADRWGRVSLDGDMTLTAAGRAAEQGTQTPEHALALDHLSAGTQELAYLSLRMALIGMLYEKELPPLIFDEAFATLDDKRLARMIALLVRQTDADCEQALVFTCHKRERKAADAIGACNVVRL